MGQTSLKGSNQQAGKFIDITKDATRAAGKIVQLIVAAASGGGGGSKAGSSGSSGSVLAEANGSNFYCGGTPGQGQFAMIVAVKGPTMNVPGRIG
jgi:hypothetical protein